LFSSEESSPEVEEKEDVSDESEAGEKEEKDNTTEVIDPDTLFEEK